jgi:hypothetical protein
MLPEEKHKMQCKNCPFPTSILLPVKQQFREKPPPPKKENNPHACNPRCSGGRAQEDHGWKPGQEIVREALSRKTHYKNRAGGVAQDVGPEFKPQYVAEGQDTKAQDLTVGSLDQICFKNICVCSWRY